MQPESLSTAELLQFESLLAKVRAVATPAVNVPVRKKRVRREQIKYLTESQVEALFRAAAISSRDLCMLTLAYCRGLRASELGRLQLADYLERDDRLTFQRLKGSAGGEYHLSKREVRTLKGWLRDRGREPGPLFLSRVGRPISRQMLDVIMKRYGAAAGLPAELCHMHSLKHSCATHLLNRGESLEDVQDHLGHRSIKSTEVYGKITNGRRQNRDRRLRDW